MFANPDFHDFSRRTPPPFPKPLIDHIPPESSDQASFTSQIYAAAWSLAHRDHELDMLFNAEFYQGRDI